MGEVTVAPYNSGIVRKFKSVNRAYKRGHIAIDGTIYPSRPFNNRTPEKGTRPLNELKKKIYAKLKDNYRP